MLTVQPFDDSVWHGKIASYRQSLQSQKPVREAPLTIDHTPYPYQRIFAVTKHLRPDKLRLERYALPRKPSVTPKICVYWGIHQIVNVMRLIRLKRAKAWAHIWLDPFKYFDETETPYNDAGGIHIGKAIELAKAVFGDVSNVEGDGLVNLYYPALLANEKVIYLKPEVVEETPANVIQLPLVELSRHPRFCAWCGTKTSSGIRSLCDQHHVRYIVNGDFWNSPIGYDELTRLIIQSDSRHRLAVMEAKQLKEAS